MKNKSVIKIEVPSKIKFKKMWVAGYTRGINYLSDK
jgi:hypothetical protein